MHYFQQQQTQLQTSDEGHTALRLTLEASTGTGPWLAVTLFSRARVVPLAWPGGSKYRVESVW